MKLKVHLLSRLLQLIGCDPNEVDGVGLDPWERVILQGNRIYSHKILRTDFTTYDVQHGQDVIHVGTPQSNVMLLNEGHNKFTGLSSHPYLYGKALGIYHANVSFSGLVPPRVQQDFSNSFQRIDFVWIHWYNYLEPESEFSLGRVSLRLLDSDKPGPEPLGFVDPADIIRATHLIPQFSGGGPREEKIKSRLVKEQDIWDAYYVNRSVVSVFLAWKRYIVMLRILR